MKRKAKGGQMCKMQKENSTDNKLTSFNISYAVHKAKPLMFQTMP